MTDPIQTTPVQPAGKPQESGSKPQGVQSEKISGPSFAETLEQRVKFSNHAQKRLERRNISLSDDGIDRLSEAVDKAKKRGGRESLVLVDNLAFIVNIQERLVVTALDRDRSGDGVFTQIDSVVFADPTQQDTAEGDIPETSESQDVTDNE